MRSAISLFGQASIFLVNMENEMSPNSPALSAYTDPEDGHCQCNHDWELFDKPAHGGFGTAQAVGWGCKICGEVQEL